MIFELSFSLFTTFAAFILRIAFNEIYDCARYRVVDFYDVYHARGVEFDVKTAIFD